MTQSLTDWLQMSRLLVVGVDASTGALRVRGAADACTELSCSEHTLVVTDDGAAPGLTRLHPGDIIKIEPTLARPEKIVVVRRAWEELASPEI
jgi:hypothetical protein